MLLIYTVVDMTSAESGFMNEKTPGMSLVGFLIMMLMPRLMNGLLKSMTRSRDDVIVNGAMARSASCTRPAQTPANRNINNDGKQIYA